MKNEIITQINSFVFFIFHKKVILSAIFFTFLEKFIKTYIFNDFEFIKFLIVLLSLDLVLIVIKSYVKKETTLTKEIESFVIRFVIYLFILILSHVLTVITYNGQSFGYFDWFSKIGYSVVLLKEVLRILILMHTIDPNSLPNWIIDKIQNIENDLDKKNE